MSTKRFGRNLRLIRKSLKLTQAELGYRIGVDGSYIGKIERGVRVTKLDVIYKLADALQVDVNELLK